MDRSIGWRHANRNLFRRPCTIAGVVAFWNADRLHSFGASQLHALRGRFHDEFKWFQCGPSLAVGCRVRLYGWRMVAKREHSCVWLRRWNQPANYASVGCSRHTKPGDSESTFNDTHCLSVLALIGSKLASLLRSSVGGATPGIYESDVEGQNPQLVLPDPANSGTTGPLNALVWSPFLEGQTFVGAHGTITASPVDGFIVSQNASVFASLLTFTTTTPSTATVTQSGTNVSGAPILFTLGGDSITNVSYQNVYNGAHTIPGRVYPGRHWRSSRLTPYTGFVDLIAPAIAGKAHPMVSRSTGTSLTYTGTFSAIFDRSGKNLAPRGASTIEIDRTSGKLISFR